MRPDPYNTHRLRVAPRTTENDVVHVQHRARALVARALGSLIIAAVSTQAAAAEGTTVTGYDDLLALFSDWRAFEKPPLRDGAPDYTAATLARKQAELKDYQARLAAIDPADWPVAQRVDYE